MVLLTHANKSLDLGRDHTVVSVFKYKQLNKSTTSVTIKSNPQTINLKVPVCNLFATSVLYRFDLFYQTLRPISSV